ncbi:uncharacterized protein [Diadema setosum]|uniref:uncharacterized protein n=1 Tax=Diadema setosum TaxID=31175 RepID=UPI003B3A8602
MLGQLPQEVPAVKLVEGPSLHEGLVVLEPDRYVCYDGFNAKAAKLVCEELGFPAAEGHTPQTLPSTAAWNRSLRLQCPEGDIQATQELTILPQTFATSPSGSGGLETQTTTLTMGTILCFVFILVVIRCGVWCNHRRKKKRKGSSDSNNSNASTTPDSCTVHHSTTEHKLNRTGDAASQEESIYHINQNSAENHNFEAEVIKISTGTNSRHLHDVIDQDSEYLAPYQNIRGNTRTEQYMDMSGTVMKNIRKDITLHPHTDTFAAKEKETDESGYLMPGVSPRTVPTIKPQALRDATGTFVLDDSLSIGPSPCGPLSLPSKPVDDSTRSGNFQSPVYEDIPSILDRSVPIREQQQGPEYPTIGRIYEHVPPPLNLNDPSYSTSIYLSKGKEEHGVDENGYLILETYAGESVGDQYFVKDKRSPSDFLYKNKTSSEVDLHRAQSSHGITKSIIYESIPDNTEF